MSKLLIFFLAGAGAGIGTGFAGMSAAVIIGPVLGAFLGIPAYQAVGIGLMSDVLASAVSAWTYKKHDHLDTKNSMLLIVCVVGMAVIGSIAANFVPDRTLGRMLQIVMLIAGIKFLLWPESRMESKAACQNPAERNIKSVIGGCIVGFICGFTGAGGGMMLLFLLIEILGYKIHMAVGTSVFIMTFTALIGGICHMVIGGLPDPACVCLCALFTLLWARIAAVIANKVSARTLGRAVGCIMVLTGVAVLVIEGNPGGIAFAGVLP